MNATRRISIALVDPHEVLRIGLRTVLQADPTLHVDGEAGSFADAVRLADRLEPELVGRPSGTFSPSPSRSAACWPW